MKWRKLIDYFRPPREEFIVGILKNMGISEKDPIYKELKNELTRVVGRRSNEEKFSQFFGTFSKQLYEIVDSHIMPKARKIDELETKLEKAENLAKLTAMQTMRRALLPKIFTLTDSISYEVLKLLEEEERSYRTLRNDLGLGNELKWRMMYFKDLGIVETSYSGRDEIYSLSDLGKLVLEKRGKDFAEAVDVLGDKTYQLALKAVGGDRIQARKLLGWVKRGRNKGHRTMIEKLHKKLKDPKKVSQIFFSRREGGDTHEKHIGIKITDHKAAGELLLECPLKN